MTVTIRLVRKAIKLHIGKIYLVARKNVSDSHMYVKQYGPSTGYSIDPERVRGLLPLTIQS